jgi:hypothetical protein
MPEFARTTLPDTALVVVCERAPRYAIAVRRLLPEAKVVEARHLDDATAALQAAPHALGVLEVEARRAPQAIALLAQLQVEWPPVRIIAGIARSNHRWELLLREAGAAFVVTTPRRLEPLAGWMRAHLLNSPEPPTTLRERIWRKLPWATAATNSPEDTLSG